MAKRQSGGSTSHQNESSRAQTEDPIPEIPDETRNMADEADDDDFDDGEDIDDEEDVGEEDE